jgi:hypothetical protein
MPWAYYLRFTPEEDKDYVGYYEPNDVDYVSSIEKIYIQATRWWGGGGFSNLWTQFTSISKKIDSLKSHLDASLYKIQYKKEYLS